MRRLVELTPGVHVATSRRELTTSTVVVGRPAEPGGVLLVDPAWDPGELEALGADMATAGWRVAAGVATHIHHDHVLWHPSYGDAPRWASAETASLARSRHDSLVAALGPSWPPALADLVGLVEPLPEGGVVPWPAAEVEVVVHGGHVPGHLALWSPDHRVLVAGDMLSDAELPLPDGADTGLARYAEALDRLAPYCAAARWVVPGHGHPGQSVLERLDTDRRYIDAVRQGRPIDDPRLANAGMRAVHEANLRLAGPGSGG